MTPIVFKIHKYGNVNILKSMGRKYAKENIKSPLFFCMWGGLFLLLCALPFFLYFLQKIAIAYKPDNFLLIKKKKSKED